MYEHLRQYPRVSLSTELWIGQDGIFTRTDEFMKDLSLGGAFIETKKIYKVGDIFNLRFKMPAHTKLISCTVIVRNMENGNGVGVQFLDLSTESYLQILEYIESFVVRA